MYNLMSQPFPILAVTNRSLCSRPFLSQVERICQALGITMAEFFSQQPTLPPEEELTAQLLEEWAALSPAQKRLVLELVHQLGRP